MRDAVSPAELLATVIAEHFPRAQRDNTKVRLGFDDLTIECRVANEVEAGADSRAGIELTFEGGGFKYGSWASHVGIGESVPAAIINGGCEWSQILGLIFASASGDDDTRVARSDVEVHGMPMRLHSASMTRGAVDEGGTSLTSLLIHSGALPVLTEARPTMVGVFFADHSGAHTIEVRVDGREWPQGAHVLYSAPRSASVGYRSERELALLVPRADPGVLTRDALNATLLGVARPLLHVERRLLRGVPWLEHCGKLAPPLSATALQALEAEIGALPDDYRAFVTTVAASGAGPGFGLVSPDSPAQRALAQSRARLALGDAGCGWVWVLRLDGDERGTVWLVGIKEDVPPRRVAASFSEWYREWLDRVLHDESWRPPNAPHCLFIESLNNMMSGGTDMRGGRIAVVAVGSSDHYTHGDPLDPCDLCARVMKQLGVRATIGLRSIQARPAPQRGWLARLFRRGGKT